MLPGIQVDPVIIQCYKTSACFATCWLALALTDFTFTPWGILGGLIWVRAAELLKDVVQPKLSSRVIYIDLQTR